VPYGSIPERLLRLVYPPGHRYHHPAIGSLADLGEATLEEVTQWFRTWYVPGNAVLAVTGGITPEQVFAAAEEYFGPVPAGAQPPDIPARVLEPATAPSRDDAAEAVPSAMTVLGFRLPPSSATDPEILACDLALRVLAGGTPSRGHERLVRELRAAQQVQALTDPRAGGNSLGTITVAAMPGADPAAVEKELASLLDALATSGPGEDELARAQAAACRELLATVSSSQGRAFTLAYSAAVFGDPGLINTAPDRITAISPGQVRQAAARWLRPDCAAIVTTRPALPSGGLSPEEHT
jgi:predicted Zn-dependent peptidase